MLLLGCCAARPSNVHAQILAAPPVEDQEALLESPPPSAVKKERELIEKIYEPELLLRLEPTQTKIIRTKWASLSQPSLC